MSDDGIGYDHLTVDMSGDGPGFESVEGVVYRHGDGSAELAGLMYNGVLLPGRTALKVYGSEFESLYEESGSDTGMEAGSFTWSGVEQVLDR